MKIVITDGYCENPGDLSWEPLKEFGELTVYDRTAPEDICKRIGDADIVITNKVLITEEVFTACPSIRYVGVLATGYNVVDIAAASKRGIPVTNIPSYGTATVAQYTIAMILELCCHIGHHSAAVKEGRWESCADFCFWDFPITELAGKTLGIIGYGKIGQAVAKIAEALGMRILANANHRRPELENENCHYADQDEIFAEADVISLHCPLTADNTGLICRENIAKMKDGVLLINTARGGLVSEADLAEALNSGKIGGAAVDVVSSEPIKGDNPLLAAKNCLITPHIAWAANEARQRLMDTAVDNVRQFLAGTPVNVVNK